MIDFLLDNWDLLLLLVIAMGCWLEMLRERQREYEDACVEQVRRNLGRSRSAT